MASDDALALPAACSALLTPYVEESWGTSAGEGASEHLILPDNCMDLIARDGDLWVQGPATVAYEVSTQGRDVSGMRFFPGALPLLLGLDARSLLDASAPLDDLGGQDAERWSARLERARRDGTLALLIAIQRSHASRVDELAAELGWSARQLQRKLPPLLGYTARRWLRVRRLRALTRTLHQGHLTDLAHRAGFADHAHMARECRALTGLTPSALRARLRAADQDTGVQSSTSTPSRSLM